MTPPPARPPALVAALAVSVTMAVAAAGCGREPAFEDRTARVTVDGRTTTYRVDSCGLDGRTAFVVGRTDDGGVVQAVIGLDAEGTGVPDSTGVTASPSEGEPSVAAFGAESWARRGEAGDPPGTVEWARVEGARIQARGRAQPVDADDQPVGGATTALRFDARCDDTD